MEAHEGYCSWIEALEAVTRFLFFSWGGGDLSIREAEG